MYVVTVNGKHILFRQGQERGRGLCIHACRSAAGILRAVRRAAGIPDPSSEESAF